MEIWKPIIGFDKYEVSNHGNVRSVDRVVITKNLRTYNKQGVLLKQMENTAHKDRMYVSLYDANSKRHSKSVPRMVAIAFIENPNNLPEVNHIDRNPRNNHINNLEWVSPKDNMKHLEENYGFTFGRTPVKGINKETGNEILFESLKDAIDYLDKKYNKKHYPSAISNVTRGNRKSAYNYYWVLLNVETIENIDF